jgi:predicted glutamine amidotransferase
VASGASNQVLEDVSQEDFVCELLLVSWPSPQPFERCLDWALRLERFGVAGFGWGVAWLEDGAVRLAKDPGRLNEDRRAQERLASVRSDRFLVHLRRPSRLSTISAADTQPFLADGGRFAFCHNGSFDRHQQLRSRFASRLKGNADSEVGFCLVQDLLQHADPERALPETHQVLGGNANLGYLDRDGRLLAYGGHHENGLWRFYLDGASVAATALHSADAAVFDLIFPNATDRRLVGREVMAVADSTHRARLPGQES